MQNNQTSSLLNPHLLEMRHLQPETLSALFEKARYFHEAIQKKKDLSSRGKGLFLANLFFEPSTRTQNAFTVAARRLGIEVLNPNMQHSALQKGESEKDTFLTFAALGVNIFVIRYPQPLHTTTLPSSLPDYGIINAGDGNYAHPSQALLDLFTLSLEKKSFPNSKVAIVGDLLHSRVARSLLQGLCTLQTTEVALVAPEPLQLPKTTLPLSQVTQITQYTTLEAGLRNSDVVIMLRIQKERFHAYSNFCATSFSNQFGLTPETLCYAKPDAVVMHPGPINRGIEIASAVADGPHSLILKQVQYGVAMRMAIIDSLALPHLL